jgi:tRNA (guanine-N7-)-methyltransferase
MNIFEIGEVERIYLNFSDPWPKNAHAKRRLTSNKFLPIYENILNENGEIHFKTDNRLLFEFSLESLNDYGLKLSNISLDLHNSDYPDNIVTEYEEKFSKFGPIYRLEAKFRK